MERWIEHAGSTERTGQYQTLPLRKVLIERRERVQVGTDLGDWQPITIKFSGEVLPRQREHAFKGAMFAAYPGDLVFSKIDARNGAIGLIPESIPKAVVTTEYPVFIPEKNILRAAWLHYLLLADHFKAELKRKASGTSGRKRITQEIFLDLEVPVPTLDEQDTQIAHYTASLQHAAQLEQEADTIERAAWQAFESALGLTPPAPLPDRPIFVARFKDVERWSHEGVLHSVRRSSTTDTLSMVPLGQRGKVSYGLQKSPANRPGIHARPYLRVANVQRGALDLHEIKYINVPDKDMPKLRLEPGDVLLCEGNSPDLVGRGAIWRGEIEHCVHQNHVLRVRVDPSRLLPEFVLAVINSSHGQAYFRSKAKRTTNLASINSKEVAALPVPDIDINRQRHLLEVLHRQTGMAQSKRTEAATLRQSARADFEAALFSS